MRNSMIRAALFGGPSADPIAKSKDASIRLGEEFLKATARIIPEDIVSGRLAHR